MKRSWRFVSEDGKPASTLEASLWERFGRIGAVIERMKQIDSHSHNRKSRRIHLQPKGRS